MINFSWLPSEVNISKFKYMINHNEITKLNELLNQFPDMINSLINYTNEYPSLNLLKYLISKNYSINFTMCLDNSIKHGIVDSFIYMVSNHLTNYNQNTIFIHTTKNLELIKLVGHFHRKKILSWLIKNYQTYFPADEFSSIEKALMLETVTIGNNDEIDFFIHKKIIHQNAINRAAFRGLYLLVFYLAQYAVDTSFLKDALKGKQTFIIKMFSNLVTPNLFEYALTLPDFDMTKWLMENYKIIFISPKIQNLIQKTENVEVIVLYNIYSKSIS